MKSGTTAPSAFQFTPLREGRLDAKEENSGFFLFQFTPLREGRRADALAAWLGGYFNSRPSARGDLASKRKQHIISYFNSRPSARGDAMQYFAKLIGEISIHAPPRGATAFRYWRQQGRTFQFTPLREGRRAAVKDYQEWQISIHAPPRGATLGIPTVPCIRLISIHAPPRGATCA